MGDEPALLAAILARPDEDTPRLMYADWLDEYGQPEQAELIRLQCAPDYVYAVGSRAFELEMLSHEKWLAGHWGYLHTHWTFSRGFPEYLRASIGPFLDRFDAIAGVPWLRFVSLNCVYDSTAIDLVNRAWPPQWVELGLWEDGLIRVLIPNYNSTPIIRIVARCPQVRQLRVLRLYPLTVTPECARELADSPHLDSLERLHLKDPGDDRLAPLRERFGDRLVIG